jgi:hypothetical protein
MNSYLIVGWVCLLNFQFCQKTVEIYFLSSSSLKNDIFRRTFEIGATLPNKMHDKQEHCYLSQKTLKYDWNLDHFFLLQYF